MIEQIREDVDPVLVLDHVSKSYEMKDGGHLTAVKDVSLTMKSGECLAIIGESGCGKSTLARLAAHLEPPDSGRIIYQGVPIHRLYKNGFKEYRRHVQLVFQNPASVFSPRMRIGTFLMEPWINYEKKSRKEAVEMARYSLKRVGLPEEYFYKYPHQLSGGELQRAVIARAIAIHPKLLICDEATSALDVSVQKQIMDLLREHQQEAGISVLFISHDLALAENFGDRIAVMYLGEIVEWLEGRHLRKYAAHPYTRALLESVFSVYDDPRKEIPILPGEPPDPMELHAGCVFSSRCKKAKPECYQKKPQMREISPGHQVSCFCLE